MLFFSKLEVIDNKYDLNPYICCVLYKASSNLDSKQCKKWTIFASGVNSQYIKDLNWNEIYLILLANNNVNYTFNFTLIKEIVEGSGQEYRFYKAGNNECNVILGVSNEWIVINTVLLNGEVVTHNSSLYAVYR